MTLTATIICLALSMGVVDEGAPSDNPTSTDLKPAPKAPPQGMVNFDALPELPQISDDVRVKRFIGAFTGGVVGLGAALALMPLGDSAGCFGTGCVSLVHAMVGALAPFLALGGAWLGFELMGGDGGLVVPAVALLPALLVGLGLLGVAKETNSNVPLTMMPYLIASGVFLAGGAAFALDLRARQVNRLGAAAGWGKATAGRVAMTALVTALSATGAALTSALLFSGFIYSAGGLGVALLGVGVLGGAVGTAAAGWGVHRAMNGRGSFLSALVGLGVGVLASGAGIGLYAISQSGLPTFNPLRNTAGTIMLVQLVVASAALAGPLALEWSHTNAIEGSLPTISLGASPTPNGGMIAAGMRF